MSDGKLGIKEIKDDVNWYHDAQYKEYGFNLPDSVSEIVNYDTAGLYRIEHPKIEKQTDQGSAEDAFLGERKGI